MSTEHPHAPLGHALIGVGGAALFGVPLAHLVVPKASSFSFTDALPLAIMVVGGTGMAVGVGLHFGWPRRTHIATCLTFLAGVLGLTWLRAQARSRLRVLARWSPVVWRGLPGNPKRDQLLPLAPPSDANDAEAMASDPPASRGEVLQRELPAVIATDRDAIRVTIERWIKRGEKIKANFQVIPTADELKASAQAWAQALPLLVAEERGRIHDWHWGVIHDLRRLGRGVINLYASGEGVSYGWSVFPNREFLDERLDELRAILGRLDGKPVATAVPEQTAVPYTVRNKRTAIQLERIADEQAARAKCGALLERGFALKGELIPSGLQIASAVVLKEAFSGSLRDRIARWCLDSRGFIYGHVTGTPHGLLTDKREGESLDEWSRESVTRVIDSYLAVLKQVKDAIPERKLV